MSTEPALRQVGHGTSQVAGRWVPGVAGLLTSVVATAVMLRGAWGGGQVLFRDFVAVPSPARPRGLFPSTAAELRGWPLDAVSWLVAPVVPPGAQQWAMLAGALVLAGCGAGLLVARGGTAAAVAAAGLAVWNPYVAERLLLGQPPTLLGYAALPWVALAARRKGGLGPRLLLLALAAAPASLTPWGGLMALLVAVAATLTRPRPRVKDVVAVTVLALTWCLPWLVPSVLAGGVPADPDGARAFALADDTGLGLFASAATGGGVWAEAAQPLSRTDPVALVGSGLILTAALAAVAALWFTRSRRLATAALVILVGPACVAAVLSGPGLGLVAAAQSLPGAALLRDQHRMLFPGVLAAAILVGVGCALLARTVGRAAAAVAAVGVLALAVTAVPDLARVVRHAYQQVSYPPSWAAVLAELDAGGPPPTVLSLPWQPLRQTQWASPYAFLDTTPRAVPGTVLTSTALTVRRGSELVVVDDTPRPEDPQWSRGVVTDDSLRRNGVTHVLEWLGTPGLLPARHDGWTLVVDAPEFRLWAVSTGR